VFDRLTSNHNGNYTTENLRKLTHLSRFVNGVAALSIIVIVIVAYRHVLYAVSIGAGQSDLDDYEGL